MDRDEFMELVYETFADEPDNVLANGIIEAADAYVEHEKAQLSQEGTTSDMISKFIDGLEETFAYIREREGGDSVCGLCEYDGAYIGQSGDWCNECPGFNRDDCFKLSDETRNKWTEEIIKALPTAQPEPLSDAYVKAVWTWLLDYQIKAAELKGRYTPYEVLSWVANDWRKEHER